MATGSWTDDWRNIPITLIETEKGEAKAQACANARFRHSPYNVSVNRYETALFVAFLPLYLVAFGLYHFMVIAVNRRRDPSEKVPHSLFGRGWSRVRNDYKTLYPQSPVYQLSLLSAATGAGIAVLFVALRIWEYTHGLR